MNECFASGATLPLAYHSALKKLYAAGTVVPCPDYNTDQLECGMTMVVRMPLLEPRISRLIPCGPRELEQYRQEILDGILDFEIERGKWAYTYHSRMAEQLPFVIEELRRNPYSRRAVIDIRDWRYDSQTDSPACLQHIQFFIRHGCLHMKVTFRSNDAVKATFMNAFALICLQERIAGELGVGVGMYTHRVNSFHAYENDWPLLKSYCERLAPHSPILKNEDSLTYGYKGEWDELMDDAKPDIAAMVNTLKTRE